ncbi:MAG: VOC family protein [Anaerolineae bacterium]|nr:VOC family protein [Anaerolineae bacterium]
MITRVDHLEICVGDIDAVAELFKKLGFVEIRRTKHHGEAVELSLPGEDQLVFEFHTGKDEEVVGVNHIAFKVDNLEEAVAEFEARGVKFSTPIATSKATGRSTCNFRDAAHLRYQLTSY